MTTSTESPANSFNYQVGGSLPDNYPAYVERQADRKLYELLKAGEYCFVFNSRQMGKSSLRVRTMQRLTQAGTICAVIDPQMRGTSLSEAQWYAGTIKRLINDLHLSDTVNFSAWWKDFDAQDISAVERFLYFIDQILLSEISEKIVIFVEEIDNLLSLKFDTDGFFILIRSFYERRAEDPRYQSLTFAFFGVATPSDLIVSKHSSAFNIGRAVEMSGFQIGEAQPLLEGLISQVNDPPAVLSSVLAWTGGQPFLTQRVLSLVLQGGDRSLSTQALVEQVVTTNIIENWEAQDVPPHLKTIRDRLLRSDERLRGQLLGLYQQVLDSEENRSLFLRGKEEIPTNESHTQLENQPPFLRGKGGISADESYEQLQLRLTGLVVKQNGKLRVYNPIYAQVFNRAWVDRALANLRPAFYAEAFRSWQEATEEQKEAFLLRGQALIEARNWAKGKNLASIDRDFIEASEEFEKRELQNSLKKAIKYIIIGFFLGGIVTTLGIINAFYDRQYSRYQKSISNIEEKLQKNEQLPDVLLDAIKVSENKFLGRFDFPQIQYTLMLQKALNIARETRRIELEEPIQFLKAVDEDKLIIGSPKNGDTKEFFLGILSISDNDKPQWHSLEKGVASVAANTSGTIILGYETGVVKKLDDKDWSLQEIPELRMQEGNLKSVGISEDESTLIVRGSNGNIKILKNGNLLPTISTRTTYNVYSGLAIDTPSIAVSRDGNVIVVAHDKGVISLTYESKDHYRQNEKSDSQNSDLFSSVAVSSDRMVIAGGTDDGSVWMFNDGKIDTQELTEMRATTPILSILAINNNKGGIVAPLCDGNNCDLKLLTNLGSADKRKIIDISKKSFTIIALSLGKNKNIIFTSENDINDIDPPKHFIRAWNIESLPDTQDRNQLIKLACERVQYHLTLIKNKKAQEICKRKNQ